jgi:hypothetical protein
MRDKVAFARVTNGSLVRFGGDGVFYDRTPLGVQGHASDWIPVARVPRPPARVALAFLGVRGRLHTENGMVFTGVADAQNTRHGPGAELAPNRRHMPYCRACTNFAR